MFCNAAERVLNIHHGFLPDLSTQGFEVSGGLLKLGVNRRTLPGGEIEVGGDDGFNVGGGTIHGRVFTAGMRERMLGDAPQHQQAAADAAGGAENEDERQKEDGLPA